MDRDSPDHISRAVAVHTATAQLRQAELHGTFHAHVIASGAALCAAKRSNLMYVRLPACLRESNRAGRPACL